MNMQALIDKARLSLNDADKTRWPDDELLVYANDFIEASKVRHPEWFFGQYLTLPADLLLTNNWPVDQMFTVAAQHYIQARAHMKDSEAAYQASVAFILKLVDATT